MSSAFLCRASRISSAQFSRVSWGASNPTAVRCSSPRRTAASSSGCRRAARAAWIRLYATGSAKWSTRTQNSNIEEHASSR